MSDQQAQCWEKLLTLAKERGAVTLEYMNVDDMGRPLYQILDEQNQYIALQGTVEQVEGWLINYKEE